MFSAPLPLPSVRWRCQYRLSEQHMSDACQLRSGCKLEASHIVHIVRLLKRKACSSM